MLLGLCAGCEVPGIALKTIKLHQNKYFTSTLLSISTSLGIFLLSMFNPSVTGIRFLYIIGGVIGLVSFSLRLILMPMTSLWQDEEQLVPQQELSGYKSLGLAINRTRHLIPLFIGLALFTHTYLHGSGKGWKEIIQRFAYPCAPQSTILVAWSVGWNVFFKLLAGVLGAKLGTLPVFLSSCYLSLFTLPLLYILSYLNYPALGFIFAAIPAAFFQCLLYTYKVDIASQVDIKDIAICWNTVSSVVNIFAAPIPSWICFHPQGSLTLFIIYSSLNSLFILYSHSQLQKGVLLSQPAVP
jgi:hypothetical protein